MGIATLKPETFGIKRIVYRIMISYKDPNILYSPKNYEDLTIFIFNLIQWLFLINVSVALANMIPASLFDGGRFFYLTILRITGKKYIAEKAFKIMTALFWALLVFLMFLWVKGLFF